MHIPRNVDSDLQVMVLRQQIFLCPSISELPEYFYFIMDKVSGYNQNIIYVTQGTESGSWSYHVTHRAKLRPSCCENHACKCHASKDTKYHDADNAEEEKRIQNFGEEEF